MKKNNWSLILPILCIVTSLLILVQATYGWLTNGDKIGTVNLKIMRINSLVHMYVGNDANRNGVPDQADTAGAFLYTDADGAQQSQAYTDGFEPGVASMAGTSPYYTETYSFTYHDTKIALAESALNMMSTVEVSGALPSQQYTFKYVLINNSDAKNEISFSFKEYTDNTYDDIDVRIGVVKVVEGVTTYEFSEWVGLTGAGTQIDLGEKLILDNISGDNVQDVWLQIRISPDADETMAGSSLTLPIFNIKFQVTE